VRPPREMKLDWLRDFEWGYEVCQIPRAVNGAEGTMVLAELAWLSRILGAEVLRSPLTPTLASLNGLAVFGADSAHSRFLFAALENDLGRFRKKLDAPAITAP
jgi:hypothetical protein